MKSLFEIHNYLEHLGFDILPVKQPNGYYRCHLYKNNLHNKTSDKEYSTWQECRDETARIIYNHLHK